MPNREDKKVQKFVNQCADFCKTAGMKSQKQIYDWLLADLMETYKGRAPKWRIESVAEDITKGDLQINPLFIPLNNIINSQ